MKLGEAFYLGSAPEKGGKFNGKYQSKSTSISYV